MLPIIAGVMLAARVPEARGRAGRRARRRLGRPATVAVPPSRAVPTGHARAAPSRTLIRGIRSRHGRRQCPGGRPARASGAGCRGRMRKGPAVTDDPAGGAAPGPDSIAPRRRSRARRPTTSSPTCRRRPSSPTCPSPRPHRRARRRRRRCRLRPPARRLRRRSHPRADRVRRRRASRRSSRPPSTTTST